MYLYSTWTWCGISSRLTVLISHTYPKSAVEANRGWRGLSISFSTRSCSPRRLPSKPVMYSGCLISHFDVALRGLMAVFEASSKHRTNWLLNVGVVFMGCMACEAEYLPELATLNSIDACCSVICCSNAAHSLLNASVNNHVTRSTSRRSQLTTSFSEHVSRARKAKTAPKSYWPSHL